MFCSRCGSFMSREALFCTNCGFELKNAIPKTEDVQNNTTICPKSRKTKNSNIWILISLIPTGVVVYFVGCILSNRLHFLFHIIAVIGGLITLWAIKRLIAKSKYPPRN